MNALDAETGQPETLQAVPALIEEWAGNLGQLLEAMTGRKARVDWHAAGGTAADLGAGAEAGVLWWEQPFSAPAEARVWIGAPRVTWESLGGLLVKAAGLESAPEGEARRTWQEVLGPWTAALARLIGSRLGEEISCAAGAEQAPPEDPHEGAVISLSLGEEALPPLAVAFSAALVKALAVPSAPQTELGPAPQPSRTMELLLDVELPVSISFGRTELPLKEVLKLTTGSIVELHRGVNEPVEILVNHCLIARGEVVVIDGNYGVRIQRIVSRQERLRSLH